MINGITIGLGAVMAALHYFNSSKTSEVDTAAEDSTPHESLIKEVLSAIGNGDAEKVEAILDDEENLEKVINSNTDLVCAATEAKEIGILKILCEKYKLPIDRENAEGFTPLHIACQGIRGSTYECGGGFPGISYYETFNFLADKAFNDKRTDLFYIKDKNDNSIVSIAEKNAEKYHYPELTAVLERLKLEKNSSSTKEIVNIA